MYNITVSKMLLRSLILTVSMLSVVGQVHAVEPASTTLTVVHVTSINYGSVPTSEDVTMWPSWPYTDNDEHLELVGPEDTIGNYVLMFNTKVEEHQITWGSYSYTYPWRVLVAPSLNAMICNVWSEDGGKTYKLVSWDYLTSTSHYIHLSRPFAPGWIGTMVHSFCGFEGDTPDVCNGRYRTNLVFDQYP